MEPCNNCHLRETCRIVQFIERNLNSSPWKISSYMHEHFMGTELVSMVSGDSNSIKLECGEYKPVKSEADYSHLTRRIKHEPMPKSSKCGSCKGKCK